jgi:tetratricopeptide (TPR) repeat protein
MKTSRRHIVSISPSGTPAPTTRTWVRFCEPAALALILLTTVVVYLPSINGRFLWDDDANVTSPELQSPAGLHRIWFEFGATQQYYPLLHTAFWLEHRLWGDIPTGYHVVSLVWHLISVLLVFAILKRLKIPGALLTAAIFALHPVMVESVAWITEQKNTLSTLFYLGSLLAYLRYDDSRMAYTNEKPVPAARGQGKHTRKDALSLNHSRSARRWYAGALILFVLAILAKSAIITLPAALLVISWWQRGTISWQRDLRPLLPFFLAAALMGLATCYVEWKHVGASGAEFELAPSQRLLLAGRAIWFYLGKLLWPENLIFIYPRWEADPSQWWQWIFPIAALATTAALWSIRNWSRSPLAAWLFFCGTLLPMLPFLNQYVFLYTFVCDHFLYAAGLGVIVFVSGLLGFLLSRLPRLPRLVATGLCIGVLAVLALQSRAQTRIYMNAMNLFEATIERNPKCWMAYNNLGVFLNANHDRKAAMKYVRTSLEINPNNPLAHANLGVALSEEGHYDEAIKHFHTAIELAPKFIAAYDNLGTTLSKMGRYSEAVDAYVAELPYASKDIILLNNLAAALIDSKRYNDALIVLQPAVELRPRDAQIHKNFGAALSGIGNNVLAIKHYKTSAELNPADAEVHYKLATLLSKSNNDAEALSHCEQAVLLKPNDANIQNQYGISLSKTGHVKDAIEHFRAAIKANPAATFAYANLANALADLGQPDEARAVAKKGVEVARTSSKQAELPDDAKPATPPASPERNEAAAPNSGSNPSAQ